MCLFMSWKRESLGGSGFWGHAPKVSVSKMAILCILGWIPCLSATVKWGIERVISQLKHVIYIGKHFIHNSCSFSTYFMSHLFVICRNHGMKIRILLGIGWFYQNAEFEHKCGFLLSRGGLADLIVWMRARPTWCRSIGVYEFPSNLTSHTLYLKIWWIFPSQSWVLLKQIRYRTHNIIEITCYQPVCSHVRICSIFEIVNHVVLV